VSEMGDALRKLITAGENFFSTAQASGEDILDALATIKQLRNKDDDNKPEEQDPPGAA